MEAQETTHRQKKQKKEQKEKSIDWKKSMAKKIIMWDLTNNILTLDEDEVPAETAWKYYSQLTDFNKVPFTQFRDRLRDNRRQIRVGRDRADEEEVLFRRDRKLHPRQAHNNRNQLVFDMTEAKELLREDVKKKLHERLTPLQLQAFRVQYAPFDSGVFKQRIYQEVRYQKYLYYLNKKLSVCYHMSKALPSAETHDLQALYHPDFPPRIMC